MKICILGGGGQLGYDLASVWQGKDVVALKREELDITDSRKVKEALTNINPAVIIHAAAYTDVEGCEGNVDLAEKINYLGTKNVVDTAERLNSTLVYVSSSHVFDGTKAQGYDEMDTPCPINVYGTTKHMGEMAVQKGMEKYYIVRTGWLFGHTGNNFIKTTMNLTSGRTILKVVHDQRGCPTYTVDLANALEQLLHVHPYGIYHLVNEGSGTWYEFAQEICDIQGIKARLEPISSQDLNQKARRPKHGVLNNNAAIRLPSWQEALKKYFMKEGLKV